MKEKEEKLGQNKTFNNDFNICYNYYDCYDCDDDNKNNKPSSNASIFLRIGTPPMRERGEFSQHTKRKKKKKNSPNKVIHFNLQYSPILLAI